MSDIPNALVNQKSEPLQTFRVGNRNEKQLLSPHTARKVNADLAPEAKDSRGANVTVLAPLKHYMTILAWLVIGLVAGFVASGIVKRRGQGILLDLALGMGGALLGGYLFTIVSSIPASGFNIYNVLTATAGAALFLFISYGIRRGFGEMLT